MRSEKGMKKRKGKREERNGGKASKVDRNG